MNKLIRKNKTKTKWILNLGPKKYLVDFVKVKNLVSRKKKEREEDTSLQPLDCLHPSPNNRK